MNQGQTETYAEHRVLGRSASSRRHHVMSATYPEAKDAEYIAEGWRDLGYTNIKVQARIVTVTAWA